MTQTVPVSITVNGIAYKRDVEAAPVAERFSAA